MNQTKIKVKCISKKETASYNKERPIQTQIELQVPYDQKNIYYQLSGGTAFSLCTVNQEAADIFIIGNDYDVLISPSEVEEKGESKV